MNISIKVDGDENYWHLTQTSVSIWCTGVGRKEEERVCVRESERERDVSTCMWGWEKDAIILLNLQTQV